jgi:hypothetical protein
VGFQVGGSRACEVCTVTEVAEGLIAAEAQHCADLAGQVVVVDVPSRSLAADGAQPTLRFQDGVSLGGGDPVAAKQVVVATPTVEAVA